MMIVYEICAGVGSQSNKFPGPLRTSVIID